MSTKSGRIGLLMFVVLGLMISHYNRELRCFEVELEDREEVISSLETDKENLTKELEQTQRELMKRIKYAFDPKNIMNPGKIWLEEGDGDA